MKKISLIIMVLFLTGCQTQESSSIQTDYQGKTAEQESSQVSPFLKIPNED